MAESVYQEKEKERLAKLWDAYELQEKELLGAREAIKSLEEEVQEKGLIIERLKEITESRDREIREMEMDLTKFKKKSTDFEPKIESLEKELGKQREQFKKLYALAEEVDISLSKARDEVRKRDEWFQDNIGVFIGMCKSLKPREEMLSEKIAKLSSIDQFEK